jgi:hypothetical protein
MPVTYTCHFGCQRSSPIRLFIVSAFGSLDLTIGPSQTVIVPLREGTKVVAVFDVNSSELLFTATIHVDADATWFVLASGQLQRQVQGGVGPI